MKKRMIAFYDLLAYLIICSPLIIIAIFVLFVLVIKGKNEWLFENWYLVVVFAISFVLPIGGYFFLEQIFIDLNYNKIIMYHLTQIGKSQDYNKKFLIYLNQIEAVIIVNLTKEEKAVCDIPKQFKLSKFLKVKLIDGNIKYIYVAHYSKNQINTMIKMLSYYANKAKTR